MANRIAAADGVFTAAGTWKTADTTMLKLDGTTSTPVTASNLDSANYTPGAITVDRICLNMALRSATTTGTLTMKLRNTSDSVDVATVTVNITDLPAMTTTAVAPGSWICFKFGAVTLTAGKNYCVRLVGTASRVNFYAGATNNWNVLLGSTTTGAPAASDRLFIQNEMTAQATVTPRTVTMDNNDTTAYGQIDITNGGSLTYSIVANTQMRVAGMLYVWAGGVLNVGTVANPVPIGTTAILEFSCASDNQFYLYRQALSVVNFYGSSKTYWKTFLAADQTAGATSITVADSVDTYWKNGDEIALASTTRTTSDTEKKTLSADGSGTTLTIAAITAARSGTAPTRAEVVNLTRNVKIQSAGTYSTSFASSSTASAMTARWAEFTGMEGFSVGVVMGSPDDVQYCSIHDTLHAGTSGKGITDVRGTFSHNVIYKTGGYGVTITGTGTLDDNIQMLSGQAGFYITGGSAYPAVFTNNTTIGNSNGGFAPATGGGTWATCSGNTAHSNAGAGIIYGNVSILGTMINTTLWRNATGMTTNTANTTADGETIWDGLTVFGNGSPQVDIGTAISVKSTMRNFTIDSEASYTAAVGIHINPNYPQNILLQTGTIGVNGAHTTGDISLDAATSLQMQLDNVRLASTVDVDGQTYMNSRNYIRSARNGQVAGAYKSWFKYGTVESNTVTVHTSTVSEKMTPNNTTNRLVSAIKTVALNSGQTCTVGVWMNKTAAYDGAQPRLMCKRNDAAGITTEAVIATYTAGTGSWNQISGALPNVVTENCVLEFYVDCIKGTGGIVYVSDWTVTLT